MIAGGLAQDLRFAVRALRKSPGFSAVAILTLALGIGANTAIFSAVNAVVFRPLPYERPEELVRIWESNPGKGFPRFSASPPNFRDWQLQTRSFSGLAAFTDESKTMTGSGEPETVRMGLITPNAFGLLGVRPLLGTPFTENEARPGRDGVVVLSEGFWRRRFGADPAVLGTSLTLGGQPVTIVGVMSKSFVFPSARVDAWAPLVIDAEALSNRGAHWLGVLGRLKPGTTLPTAEAELKTVAAALAAQYPEKNLGWSVAMLPYQAAIVGNSRAVLLLLLGAVAAVLLIACANVSNLLLVRAASREKEIAIRSALGAGRGRLLSGLLCESLVLGVAGAGLGLLFARWVLDALLLVGKDALPRRGEVALDGTTLLFTAGIALLTSLLVGLWPALRGTEPGQVSALRESLRGSAGTRGAAGRRALAGAEIALTLVLLAGAALLLRSMSGLLRVDPGFRTEKRLVVDLSLQSKKYEERPAVAAFYDELLARVRALPGVESAATTSILPLSGGNWSLSVKIEGRPGPEAAEPSVQYRVASAGYFETMGIPIREGRVFSENDRVGAPLVAVVTERAAKRLFPGERALGKKLVVGDRTPAPREIVGVVGDVKQFGLDEEALPELYVAAAQKNLSSMSLVVRTSGDPMSLAPAIRAQIRGVDKDLPVGTFTTLETIAASSLGSRRVIAALLGLFAGLALVLAVVGVYGVMSYAAETRNREMGIRLALGADRSDIVRLLVGEGARFALAGLAAGLVLCVLSTRLLASFLFGVGATDVPTLGAAAVFLASVTLLACYLPARRASTADPMAALRSE